MLSGMLGPATGSIMMSTPRPWVISSLMHRSKKPVAQNGTSPAMVIRCIRRRLPA
jgi:hypothetical protein